MTSDSSIKPPRKPRADGERNRARLIEAARKVFAEQGADAGLGQVAREAEVGIGTLYRHFRSRDALITSIYQQEIDTLVDAAPALMNELEPLTALREWLLQFVDFLETKQGMADVLSTLIGGTAALYSGTSECLAHAIEALTANAVEEGALEVDVEPLDLLRAIGGIANLTPDENWRQSAVHMIDVLLKGMRVSR